MQLKGAQGRAQQNGLIPNAMDAVKLSSVPSRFQRVFNQTQNFPAYLDNKGVHNKITLNFLKSMIY